MRKPTAIVIAGVLSILSWNLPAPAQDADQQDHERHEEHAEAAEPDERDEGHGGRRHHKNSLGVFVGVTDEHGYALEPTLGIDYRRMVAKRVAVGALFDYAGGELRNSIFAASLTWLPIGRLLLTAAPGVEFHRGRGQTIDCGCSVIPKSEDPGQSDLSDEDATYFVFRLGAGWHFPIGQIYGVSPNLNVDFVDGETVWVYGVTFTFAW